MEKQLLVHWEDQILTVLDCELHVDRLHGRMKSGMYDTAILWRNIIPNLMGDPKGNARRQGTTYHAHAHSQAN